MENSNQKKGLNVSVKSFLTAIAVLFVLMILTYVLTIVIPGGSYARTLDADGNTIIDTSIAFQYIDGGIPFWKWLLSPILVLGAEGNGTLLAVIAFLLVVGGIFNSLEKCGLMKYMMDKIVHAFGHARYKLLAVMILFFMAMGAFIGSFEEVVPLVPLIVALAIRLGWDSLTALGMSILAAGCGFASGVCNPFTVGVAQRVAGLPMFSGMGFRVVGFVCIYLLLWMFIRHHAKKVEKPLAANVEDTEFKNDKKMNRALFSFVAIVGTGILVLLCSAFITALQDYSLIIVAVMFLIAGIVASLTAGMSVKRMLVTAKDGMLSILPAVLLILMASSIKYILVEANILDTILYYAVTYARTLPKWVVILFIYLLVLVMNFFIATGSAKAILMIPLITPLAQIFGISAQLCVLAYAFGDGFSNAFYPTNPVLLISLELADVSYGKWAKWSGKFQLLNLVLTSLILLLGLAIGY